MAINLYSKASVDSLLSPKLSISSLTNAAATTLNATAPTTNQVLSFDGTELKWATPASGGGTWGSITGTLSSQTDLWTELGARVSTAGDTMDNNAILEFNDTTTNSHLGITGNAITIENAGLALSSTLDKDKLVITDGTDTAEISLSGVKFADGSVQTTAYTGGGGSWLGNRISIYAGYLYNEDTSTYVSTLTLQGASTIDAQNITLQAAGGGVLTFADATTQSTAAVGIPSAGATGQVLKKNSGTNYDVSWANDSGCDVQTFGSSSTSGSFTWTKPTGAKWVEFYLVGGGGGGGSGSRQATTSGRSGGGGGSGGSSYYGRINAAYLGGTENVTVGSGGAGALSVSSNSTNGSIGGNGTATSFSIYRSGNGAGGGAGSTTSGGAGAQRSSVSFISIVAGGGGAAGATTTGATATDLSQYTLTPSGGGGGAGAVATSTTAAAGGAGAAFAVNSASASIAGAVAGGSGGTTAGVAATAGTSATTQYMQAGTGGGGGYYRTGEAGGTGGAGGWPGGGGGGGGASDNGFASGAGGAGANGFAVIITYF